MVRQVAGASWAATHLNLVPELHIDQIVVKTAPFNMEEVALIWKRRRQAFTWIEPAWHAVLILRQEKAAPDSWARAIHP